MMFALPAFFTSKAFIAAVGGIAVIGCLYFVYNLGVSNERARIAKATIELLQQRDAINGKVSDYSSADLCGKLGGKWVLDHCE